MMLCMIEIKKLAARRYAEGILSFDGLMDILGYGEATKIAYYKDIAEVSLAQGLV